jgi:hypothetical protein
MIDPPGTGLLSNPAGINDRGQIVGSADSG